MDSEHHVCLQAKHQLRVPGVLESQGRLLESVPSGRLQFSSGH